MKYEFTGETKEFTPWFDKSKSIVVQRIRYTETGELGGFIENESNLSQDGDCHIDEETVVFGNAKVYGNANVTESEIGGSSQIYDNATVTLGYTLGNTKIYGNAVVTNEEESLIDGDTQIYDNAHVKNMGVRGITNAKIHDNAQITGAIEIDGADIYENAELYYSDHVSGKIHGSACIFNRGEIGSDVEICGNSKVNRGYIFGPIKFEDSVLDWGLKSVGLSAANNENIKVNICGVNIDEVFETMKTTNVSFTKSATINKDNVLSEFLPYASDECKNDKDFALAVVKENGNNVKYMSDDLKNDKDVALAAVSQNGNSVRYLSKEMRSDKDVAKAAITQNEGASRYVSKTVLNGLNDFIDGVDSIKIPDGDETI